MEWHWQDGGPNGGKLVSDGRLGQKVLTVDEAYRRQTVDPDVAKACWNRLKPYHPNHKKVNQCIINATGRALKEEKCPRCGK